MNCLFCHAPAEGTLTKEHLLSKPICRLLGIERAEEQVGRFNATTQTVESIASLESTSVRSVCGLCNSGWMRRLEHGIESALAAWLAGEPLDDDSAHTLRRWMAKTHLVLSMIEGRAHKIVNDPINSVLMDFTLAREVHENTDLSAKRNTRFGAARTPGSSTLRWAFGTPTIRMPGPKKPNNTIAATTVLLVNGVQLWTVNTPIPIARDNAVTLPPFTASIRTALSVRRLPTAARGLNPARAVVDYAPLTRDHYEQMFAFAAEAARRNEGDGQ